MSLPSLKDFMDAMGAKWSTAAAVFLGSAVTIGAAEYKLPYAEDLPEWLILVLFLLGVFSAAILLVETLRGVGWIIRRIGKWRAKRRLTRSRLKQLDDLPNHEGYVLAYLFTRGTQAFTAPLQHAQLIPLVQKGLIIQQSGTHGMLDWPYYVPDYVWAELKRRESDFRLKNPQNMPNPLSRW